MIGYRNGKMVTLCDHCAQPIPEGEVIHANLASGSHSFCSARHAASYSPLPYRCPDCVLAGTDPCEHQEHRKRPDRAGDSREPVG